MDKELLVIEKDINSVLEFAEGIIVIFLQFQEQTQEQYTKLYWTGIRLLNNRDVFKIDVEIMNRLCKEVEVLSCFQNVILEKARTIQKQAKRISDELKEEDEEDIKQTMKLYSQMKIINKEIDNLRILYERYHQEQIAFIKAINNVGELFKERLPEKKVTIEDKVKNIIKNRRK